MCLEICMQVHSVVLALSRQINKQKVCEKVITFVQVIKFLLHIELNGGILTPTPLCVRP